MRTNNHPRTKSEIINQILDNSVYLPESGVYKNLVAALTKMSRVDLSNLHLLITLKRHDVVENAREVDAILAKNENTNDDYEHLSTRLDELDAESKSFTEEEIEGMNERLQSCPSMKG